MTYATGSVTLTLSVIAALFAASAQSANLPSREAIEQMMMQKMGSTVESDQPRTEDGVQVVMQSGHAGEISQTAMSPDGRAILTGSWDGTVKVWDVASGKELRTFSGFQEGMPQSVMFSTDSKSAIIGDGLQTYLFDVDSGRKLQRIGGLGGISPFGGRSTIADGARYVATAVGDNDSTIKVIEIATGREVWSTPKGDVQTPLALSADGSVLLSQRMKVHVNLFGGGAALKTNVQLWDVAGKKLRGPLPAFPESQDARSARFVLSPDGRYVIVDESQKATRLYAIDSAEPIATLQSAGQYDWMHAPVFSPDGTMALHVADGGTVSIWQTPSGHLLKQIPGKAAAFSADGKKLVLGLDGVGAPVIHELASGQNTQLSGGVVAVWELATVGASRAVAAMRDGSTRLWDLTTGVLMRNLDCPEGSGATAVSAGHGEDSALTSCSDGSVWRWNLASTAAPTELVAPFDNSSTTRTLSQFTPDGQRIVLAREGTVIVLNASDGREIRRFTLPAAKPKSIDPFAGVDPSELKNFPKEAIDAMNNARATQQDPAIKEQMRKAVNMIATMAVHPSGRLLVIGRSEDLSVWDLETGTLVRSLGGVGSGGSQPDPNSTQPWAIGGNSGYAAPISKQQMKQLQKLIGAAAGSGAVVMPSTSVDDALGGMFSGASHVAFRQDGALLSIGANGPRLWDATSGRRLPNPFGNRAVASLTSGELDDPSEALERITNAAFSPDGRIVALVEGSVIHLMDAVSGAEVATLTGHRSDVVSVAFTADGQRLVSGGSDGTLRVWSVPQARELAQLIALGHSDFVAVTPDQYYRASRSRVKGIAFRVKGEIYPFEQFDLRFNRPDIVLERLGLASADVVQAYRQSYQRRLKKLGFTEAMLGADFHLPEVAIAGADVPVSTDAATLSFTVRATDTKYPLDRLQMFVNDVPIFGSRGVAIDGDVQSVEREVTAPLVPGRNKIQVSALNREGAESLRATAYTNATGAFPPGDIYVVTVGVSQYANSAYNLRYAAKDAGDLAALYSGVAQRVPGRGATHVLSLTNQHATRDEIRAARDWLSQAKVGDLAIVFAAGHGLTDAANDYYFGTFDIDPQNPSARGLPYEDFEALLDGIAPLRKMLLIDTCFSGEIDKDEAVVVADATDSTEGQVKMRAFKTQRGVQVTADDSGAANGATDALKFQQDWFSDLRRGTGAVVISSASGNEYAFEGEQWNNGVFTYALLQGLENGAADTDHDARITVGELQAYVIDQVRKLTAGGQNPTVRRENLDYDFEVY